MTGQPGALWLIPMAVVTLVVALAAILLSHGGSLPGRPGPKTLLVGRWDIASLVGIERSGARTISEKFSQRGVTRGERAIEVLHALAATTVRDRHWHP